MWVSEQPAPRAFYIRPSVRLLLSDIIIVVQCIIVTYCSDIISYFFYLFIMSEIDSEILILEVEKHPCLYDLGNENYKNRTTKKFIRI